MDFTAGLVQNIRRDNAAVARAMHPIVQRDIALVKYGHVAWIMDIQAVPIAKNTNQSGSVKTIIH